MRKLTYLFVFFLTLCVAGYCGQVSRIELTDGSVINGEIVSYSNGVYTINSATFGEIRIEGSKVSKIETGNSPSPSAQINSATQPGNLTQPQIDAYREKLLSNPAAPSVVSGLANDPQIQELLKDPEIMAAAKAGDIQALMKNEKFKTIANNPKMQEAVEKLKQ